MNRRQSMAMWVMVMAIGLVSLLAGGSARAEATHEWHTIAAAPGQLDAVHARLRDRVLPALDSHGLWALAVLTPAGDNPDGLVHLIVAVTPARAADADRLATVPEWQAVIAGSSPLATPRSVLRLRTTPWSPLPAVTADAAARVFELRTYTSPDAAKRTALLARFEHHTLGLFKKHGMTNVIYWTPDGGPDADTKLVYLLAHASPAAAKASFDAFRKDPDWTAAKTASETAAGGSLTIKEKGVVSEFLAATDYSPLR